MEPQDTSPVSVGQGAEGGDDVRLGDDGTVLVPPTGGERADPPDPDVDEDTVLSAADPPDPAGDDR